MWVFLLDMALCILTSWLKQELWTVYLEQWVVTLIDFINRIFCYTKQIVLLFFNFQLEMKVAVAMGISFECWSWCIGCSSLLTVFFYIFFTASRIRTTDVCSMAAWYFWERKFWRFYRIRVRISKNYSWIYIYLTLCMIIL